MDALFAPTAVAQGLPGRFYSDDNYWEFERRQLFSKRWVACAFESDVPEPGDAKPVTLAGWELIVARNQDNEVNVFHNLCAHRGMRVLDVACHGEKSIQCPWHSWTYDMNGRLVATPNLGGMHVNNVEGFNREKLGLKAVRCESWLNFVFVNIDGLAPPLPQFLTPLHKRLSAYDLSALKVGEQCSEAPFKGNWKLVMEGGIEDYHVPWIHPQMGTYGGTFTPEYDDQDVYVGFSTRADANRTGTREVDIEQSLPVFANSFENLPDDGLGAESIIVMIPPSAVIAVVPNHVMTAVLQPEQKDLTIQRRSFQFLGTSATDPAKKSIRQKVRDTWVTVGAQDEPLAQALQSQHRRREELNIPTRFSPHWEQAVHHFQKMIAPAPELTPKTTHGRASSSSPVGPAFHCPGGSVNSPRLGEQYDGRYPGP